MTFSSLIPNFYYYLPKLKGGMYDDVFPFKNLRGSMLSQNFIAKRDSMSFFQANTFL